MNSEDRKAALSAYKERKTAAGIYAVRCGPSGDVWVGQSRNVEPVQNRIWFTLRGGASTHRTLQKAWGEHGAESFSFELLERVEDEQSPYLLESKLKERAAHWRNALRAQPI